MPLLHQDDSRGGGGPSDDRQSRPFPTIAEILDTMLPEPVGASAVTRNECSRWWDSPGSPEAAQTPRSLVPAACFPTQHPRAFTSFSESAQPGGSSTWNGTSSSHAHHNGTDNRIQDLISSWTGMTMASAGGAGGASAASTASLSPQPQTVYDNVELWSSEPHPSSPHQRDETTPNGRPDSDQRRASYCGVSIRNGCTALRWAGKLPARSEDPDGGFSSKLFLGGLPWDITEPALIAALKLFQPVCVEWPERAQGGPPRGFAYVTLESERHVLAFLGACRRDGPAWYYRLHSRKMRAKEVQVIPWAVADANWAAARSTRLEAGRTVFVGALHGMLSAAALAIIMNDLFSGVVYAGIDTDKHKYPIGSGRVTFDNVRSYVRAISAAFIEIHTEKFTKKVQIDPYLEDSMCTVCNLQQGPYFCREPTCFGYFCRSCWSWQHAADSGREEHKALLRSSKNVAAQQARGAPPLGPAPARPGRGAPPPGPILARPARLTPPHADPYNGHYSKKSDGSPSPPASGASGPGGSGAGGTGGAGIHGFCSASTNGHSSAGTNGSFSGGPYSASTNGSSSAGPYSASTSGSSNGSMYSASTSGVSSDSAGAPCSAASDAPSPAEERELWSAQC